MTRGATSRRRAARCVRYVCTFAVCAGTARAQEPAGGPPLTPNELGQHAELARAENTAEGAATETEDSYPVHGAVRLRGRGRWRADENDLDLYATVELDAGDVERNTWTWHLTAQALVDADGEEPPTSSFFSLEDAEGSGERAYLYEAYGERRGDGTLEVLRAGRQTEWRTPVFLWFDGASVRTRAAGKTQFVFGAYGGLPVHQYETSRSGDQVFGAWTELKPWSRALVRLDYVHLEDEERLGSGNNDLLQLALGQALGEQLRFDATYSRLENEDRDASLRAVWADAESDATVSATFYRLIEPQNTLALELDPLTSALLELEPYWEARISASKGVNEHLRLDAGYDARRLANGIEESTFNHELDRAYLSGTVLELPLELEFTLTGETWDSSSDEFRTWGADVTRRFGDDQRISVGTSYALYKVDVFQEDEREDVRTTYVRWRVKRTEGWGWDTSYEYEDDPGEDLQVLRVGATWKF